MVRPTLGSPVFAARWASRMCSRALPPARPRTGARRVWAYARMASSTTPNGMSYTRTILMASPLRERGPCAQNRAVWFIGPS
jgi:hypothetical protein